MACATQLRSRKIDQEFCIVLIRFEISKGHSRGSVERTVSYISLDFRGQAQTLELSSH